MVSSYISRATAGDSAYGAQLFVTHCGSCYGQSAGQSEAGRAAPPIVAVKDHYRRVHADQASFVAAMSSWAMAPTADSTFMPGAIKRFGLMPAVEVSEAEAIAIAEFVYLEQMGYGKSSVGRSLARKVGYRFLDSDREIEARCGVDIPTIFDYKSGAGFREREPASSMNYPPCPASFWPLVGERYFAKKIAST